MTIQLSPTSDRRPLGVVALLVALLGACTSESSMPGGQDEALVADSAAQPGAQPITGGGARGTPSGAADAGPAADASAATVDAAATATDAGAPRGPLRAFVSSQRYNGALGGTVGADAKCSQLATAAGLGGKWMAWISSLVDNSKASDRLTSAGPWQRLDGKVVATNKPDLLDGYLAAALSMTETKAVITSEDEYVWTGTHWNFPVVNNCQGWTNATASTTGFIGRVVNNTYTSSHLWQSVGAFACNSELRLYCFEL